MASLTDNMKESDLGMSNFDHSIDDGLSDELRGNPNQVYGTYAGYNFYALVWHDGREFVAEVWQYKKVAGIIREATLRDMMESICSEYGYE